MPLWSKNVVQTIGPLGTYLKPGKHAREVVRFDPPGLTFLDDHRLIVYDAEPTGTLSSHVSGESSYVLHMSVLDAGTGKTLFTRDWPLHPYNQFLWKYSIHVTAGGVLVRTGEILRICSREFSELRDFPLSHSEASEDWSVHVSPSGRTVLLAHSYYGKFLPRWTLMDGVNLTVRRSWIGRSLIGPGSISDEGVVGLDGSDLVIIPFGATASKLIDVKRSRYCLGGPWFVTEDTFVYSCPGEIFWVTTDGKVLMANQFQKRENPLGAFPILLLRSPVAPDMSGHFVAINVTEVKGSVWLDTYHSVPDEVVVYDLADKQRALTVAITHEPKGAYGFALSPDGSKLAILQDHNVSEYSVPAK